VYEGMDDASKGASKTSTRSLFHEHDHPYE